MSAGRDFNSIYRLEFYKKQKNWKLCTSKKSQDKSQKAKKYGKKTTLNVTYSIDDGDAKEYFDPHNMAFIQSPPVEKTTSNILSASTEKLSLEWQEPIHICPHSETKDDQSESKKPQYNLICNRLAALQIADALCKEDKNNNEIEIKETGDWGKWSQRYDCNDPMHVEGAAHMDIKAQEAEYEKLDGNSRMMSQYHQTDLPGSIVMGDSIDCSVTDSEGEFIRGAHAAPHSSEIDLSMSSILSDIRFKKLSRLSSRQLDAAAHYHSQALLRLFQEATLRQSLTRPLTDYVVPLDGDQVLASSYLH